MTERLSRDGLGRLVRAVWVEWAEEQPDPKPSWLQPYDRLAEADREVDRRIGDRLAAEGAVALARLLVDCGLAQCGAEGDEVCMSHLSLVEFHEALQDRIRLITGLDVPMSGTVPWAEVRR